jgi:hypothetical protein
LAAWCRFTSDMSAKKRTSSRASRAWKEGRSEQQSAGQHARIHGGMGNSPQFPRFRLRCALP